MSDIFDVYISDSYCGATYDVPALINLEKDVSLYITGLPVSKKEIAQLEIETPDDLSGQNAPQMGACF